MPTSAPARYRRMIGDRFATGTRPGPATVAAAGILFLIACLFTIDPLLARLVGDTDPKSREWFYKVTRLGESDWVFVLCALSLLGLYLLFRRQPPRRLAAGGRLLLDATLFVLAAVAGSGLVVQAIKHAVGRARPKYFETLGATDFSPFMFDAGHASFPSGHTATAFALATVVMLFRRQWAAPAFVFAALIGISRIATSAHYFSDVIGGAVVGAGFTLLVHRQMAKRRRLFVGDGNGGVRLRGSALLWRFPCELTRFLGERCRQRSAPGRPSSA